MLLVSCGFWNPANAANVTTFYFVDVGHGNATFVVAPTGEVVLLDCGPTRAADRIVSFARQNGIQKVDYLIVSHFEDDHMGAAPKLSEAIPILNWVDHGETVTDRKSDDWWAARRTLARGRPRPGVGKMNDDRWDTFRAAREKQGNHIVVKAGDRVPVKGLD